jgi:hypothetical protein
MKQLAMSVALCLLLATPLAHAGDAAAEALFRAGREAAQKEDYATACARFEESNRLDPAVGTVFNIAHCREKLGQVASAWQRYREARDRLPADDERTAVVAQRIAMLEPRLPKMTLHMTSRHPSAVILRDGVQVGSASLGLSLPVDPGRHEIIVRVRGHVDRRINFEIKEAEQQELTLEPGPPLPTMDDTVYEAGANKATPAPAAPAPSTSSQRTWGFVVGGIGVAGLATSLAAGVMVLSKKDTVSRECSDKLCTRAGLRAAESGHTLSTVSTVAFAVGVLGVAAGTYLILTAPNGKERARLELRAAPSSASVQIGTRF